MRLALLIALALGTLSCATGEVKRLDLRDPRLPAEARRWLADAEDEVAIAWARVDDARAELKKLNSYHEAQLDRLQELKRGQAKGAGENAFRAFAKYGEERIALAEMELEVAEVALELARMRLTQARAETAVRYDVKIYELEPIVREVESLRDEVAETEREVEEQRANVEHAADGVWKSFKHYVSKGGVTNALWGAP
jgi:hypothetical protein